MSLATQGASMLATQGWVLGSPTAFVSTFSTEGAGPMNVFPLSGLSNLRATLELKDPDPLTAEETGDVIAAWDEFRSGRFRSLSESLTDAEFLKRLHVESPLPTE